MKISTFTKLASIFCVAISTLILGLIVMMNLSIEEEHRYIQRQMEFRALGHNLGQASDFLTREARRYTIFGDKRHYDAFWKEVNETKTRDKVVERLQKLGAAPAELALIETAKTNSDALIATEKEAMEAVAAGDLERARTLMFDENYDKNKEVIMAPIEEFQKIVNARAEKEALAAHEKAKVFLVATQSMIVLYMLLVILALYFIFIRKITHPLVKITKAMDQITDGKTGVSIPYIETGGEIGKLAHAAELLQKSLIKNQEMASDLLQSRDHLARDNQRTKFLFHIAAETIMAETPTAALDICVEQVCRYTGWNIGHVYEYDEEKNILSPIKTTHLQHTPEVGEFQNIIQKTAFAPEDALAGRVLEKNEFVYIPEIARDKNFPFKDALAKINVKSGIAFPVSIRGEVAYVLEFFIDDSGMEINEDLQKIVQFVISQLQQTVERTTFTSELAKAKDKAIDSNLAKSRFLATMSHEIRTPLNGVVGMSELLLGSALTDKQKHYASVINNSSEVLMSIIGDILDFSKIEAGEMDLTPVPVDLYRQLKDAMSVMNSHAEERNVEFIFKYDHQIPDHVLLDPVRIKQLILNLAGNAIKFTKNGYILINVKKVDSDGSGDLRLRCEIEDNGIGIAKDKQKKIFDRFTQADDSTTRKYGGTGLGLAICRKLISLMDGEIGVKSKLGEGSTFWFEIPTKEVEGKKRSGASKTTTGTDAEHFQNQRILIVDDFAANRDVLEGYLHSWNIECHAVSSGKEALDALEKADKEKKPYTLALIDYMMPEMNGEELGKKIHTRPQSKDLPLIMVTAIYKIENTNRAVEMGFKKCILKPIYASELMDAMLEVITGQTYETFEEDVPSHVTDKITLQNGTAPKILVAEDSRVNQMVTEEILHELGCEVEIAKNGKVAFEQYQKNAYDLILMDCMMPEMDGYEATKVIREYDNDNDREHMPIVAMTANAMEGDKEKCLQAGMDDYIAKPARRDNIKSTLEKYLIVDERHT